MSKQNDLILTLLGNPQFTTEDFLKVGLSANNTSLEDEQKYLDSEKIQSNPLFQNESGEFDKNKFHSVYVGATKMMQDLTDKFPDSQTIYSKYNIFAPVSQRDLAPQFDLVKAVNPDRITKSMITIGRDGAREYTPAEIAQSQQVFNSETGSWMDTPEDMFSFKKLFGDFTGFFSDNFGATKVLAQYEEDVDYNGHKRGEAEFDENMIEHRKGEYMLNDSGTYYYRTLKNGENIYGKQVLHYSDILTREGSALNSIDFLDSDDIQKTPFGSFVKNASLIGAMFLPGVGEYIAGATILQQAAGLGATLGKIALGSDNAAMNWIEGLSESTNPLNTRSEYSSGDKMWTIENLLGMVGDVVGQLRQQRLLFKWAPVITKGKWGVSEESQLTLKNKYIQELESKNVNSLEKIIAKYGKDSVETRKASAELLAKNQMEAAALVENYMKDYYKAGEELSKAYMTLLTVNDIYGEAKEAGASDFDSALITAGYAAMEYALLSSDIGKWILPELRASRIQNKAIVKALTKDTLETFKKLGAEAGTSETAKRTYIQRLVDFGKNIAKGEFNVGLGERAAFKDGEGLLKAGFGSLLAGGLAEGTEETTEEVLADISRILFNGLQSLKRNDSVRMQKPWEDDHLFDRYSMSFLGGLIGGGVSSAATDFRQTRSNANMDYNQAVQQLIWKARNNDLDGLFKILDKEQIGNKTLSATQFEEDENGTKIWKQGDENDNQDLAIKNLIRRQINLLQNTLEAHGGTLSDETLIDAQTLKDLRFRSLHNSTTAGAYIQKYNQTLGKLIEKTTELRRLDSLAERAENGETDEKRRQEGESKNNEVKRKKLQEEIKQLDEQIENFNSGRLAPLFMTSALLESTPFISEVFMRSSFRTFAEHKANSKFEDIPEGELKQYLTEYQNYLRTTKKDDLDFATEGYLALQKIIGSNFEEAKQVAELMLADSELKTLLSTTNLTTELLNMSKVDDDTWQETFAKYISENPLVDQFRTNIQLLRNTYNETSKQLDDKFNQDLEVFKQKLDSGEWDEELYNNTVNQARFQLNQDKENANSVLTESIAKINTDLYIQQASQLADKFINLGYINGAIKDQVIGKLNELIDNLTNHLYNKVGEVAGSGQDEDIDRFEKLRQSISEIKNKIEQIKKLKYTPILQNLDQFGLNLNGTKISQILEELGNAIQTNKTSLSSFTFGQDIYHAINEADRVIDLYIAALEGARTDTIDPFNPTKTNVWGINKVINEIHQKAPKVENDTWEDLPEIDGDLANMMLVDAHSIKNLLLSYKKLFDINRGQKLEIQSRVGARTSYLIYDRIRRLLDNADFPKDLKGLDKFRQIFDNLEFFNNNIKGKEKKDWKINLNKEEQIALEKDRLSLEDALFDLFNNPENDLFGDDLSKLESFFTNTLFKLGDRRTTLLTENAEDIDDSSIIGYLASKIAIKSSDFYSRFKEIIKSKDPNHPIAPILGQEIGVQLGLANVLNGPVLSKIIRTYRNTVYKHVKGLDFDGRVKFFKDNGASLPEAYMYATNRGFNKFFAAHDLVPQYSNITFVDGVAGSGKTSSIDSNVIKYLQKYNPETLKKVWTAHGGDPKGSTEFAKGLRQAIGLTEDDSLTFNKDSLMDKITPDRTNLQVSKDGKSYEFKDSDYKLINGKLVPTWKINTLSDDEIPSLIVIDEAQQFTQLDLLTIDKFARQYGIPVIMSGDLQQTQMGGSFRLSDEDVSAINQELAIQKATDNQGNPLKFLNDDEHPFSMTLKLTRNQVLHTPKIGTSMRTENNQKNFNMSMMQALMELGKGTANFHYFESDSDLAGDKWVTSNQIDEVKRLLDKIIPNLGENEKVNFAYNDENSKIFKALKSDSKYWDKINPIQGVALGQEGNYWILDINPNQDIDSYLQDLYTGITRAKKASIIVTENNNPVSDLTITETRDTESHPEKYSKKAIDKFIDKRLEILEAVLDKGNDIPYNPRQRINQSTQQSTSQTQHTSQTPTPPSNPQPTTPSSPPPTITSQTPTPPVAKYSIGDVFQSADNGGVNGRPESEFTITSINDDGTYGIKFTQSGNESSFKIEDLENWVATRLMIKIDPNEETNVEPEPIEETPIEEISEESESNEEETQEVLSNANIEDNSPGIDSIEISGLGKDDFNFFLFTNATFELGTTQINDDGTFSLSPIQGRIDGLNGLVKNLAHLGITNVQDGIKKLAVIRNLLMSIEDKARLEQLLSRELGVDQLYVRYAIKTSEFNSGNGKFDKLDKEADEGLPFARAQVDPNSESNTVNNRHIVAIIGTENGKRDLLELPLLTLNNPITIIQSHIDQNTPRFPEIYNAYNQSYQNWLTYTYSQPQIQNPEGFAQVYALDDMIKIYDGNPKYQGLVNLIKEYRHENRHITFIDDPSWTIGKNLHTFGPQLNIHRGVGNVNPDYIQEDRWIPLSQLKQDPQLKFSSIMQYTDKSGTIEDEETGEIFTLVSKPKHPFVLFTDASVDHEGNTLSSDKSLIREYIYQKSHPKAKQTIKLIYVLPPKFTLKEYLTSLIDFTTNNGKFVLGNQRTAFNILEALIYDVNGNVNSDTIDVFKKALGADTGEQVYNKVKEVIDSLKDKSFNEQIQALTNDTPQAWNINGFGINSEVQLYQQLQNVLKQLVYPTAFNIETSNISHVGVNRFDELFPDLETIFNRKGLSMFFQTRGSKEQSQIIYGRFSPIQDIDSNGNLKNDYISEHEFYINGNLTTSTFMADAAFNDIIEKSLAKQRVSSTGQIQTQDNIAYTGYDRNNPDKEGYSGFNPVTQQTPSLSKNIADKLAQYGITTSVNPTVANDNSIQTKQAIANEINSNIGSPVRALVLPNGELILGMNPFFVGKEIQFNLSNNPFESQQNYMFDAVIDGKVYDVIYSETNSGKNMELTERGQTETVYNFAEFKPLVLESINTQNYNKFVDLLTILAQSSKPLERKIQKILELPQEEAISEITKFLNSPITKMAFRKLSEQNFDFSQFTDILEFEQQQDSCATSININFI